MEMQTPFLSEENSEFALYHKDPNPCATAIKEMLRAVISDDIKITISRDEIVSGTAKIHFAGKNYRFTHLINHLDLGYQPGLEEHVSLLIIRTLQEVIEKERNWNEANDMPQVQQRSSQLR